jgi:hypothetical protein
MNDNEITKLCQIAKFEARINKLESDVRRLIAATDSLVVITNTIWRYTEKLIERINSIPDWQPIAGILFLLEDQIQNFDLHYKVWDARVQQLEAVYENVKSFVEAPYSDNPYILHQNLSLLRRLRNLIKSIEEN